MTAAASTALDRYRAAKLELDAFDAFTKLAADEAPKVSAEASMSWKNTPGYPHLPATVRINNPFNRFMAAYLMREREALFALHRAELVAAVAVAKATADAEAVATIKETPPT